ncbi:MAG: hypothetical protein MR428_04100 [Mesosutterella sp.]|nr:hypothetical protein [Mesosutterella sp.]
MDKTSIPWFVPKVSPALAVIVRNLGHKVTKNRGDVLYKSDNLFERVIYVQSGIAAKAVFLPGFDTSFFVSLALPGSLIGCIDTLYANDQLSRQHWAVTGCELLTVPRELLLKLADHDGRWHRELAGYNAGCNFADRLGLMVSRAGESERRLGVFLVAFFLRSSGAAVQELHDDKKEWIALPDLPPRRLIAQIIGCEVSKVDEILLLWIRGGIFKKIHRSLLIRREKLLENLQWLSQFA